MAIQKIHEEDIERPIQIIGGEFDTEKVRFTKEARAIKWQMDTDKKTADSTYNKARDSAKETKNKNLKNRPTEFSAITTDYENEQIRAEKARQDAYDVAEAYCEKQISMLIVASQTRTDEYYQKAKTLFPFDENVQAQQQ